MKYDVVVVGGGHAGCEAAAAAARLGADVLLITHDLSKIGVMSCNCAVGGIGKGVVTREVDALDGIMGKAIDNAGIHFSLLNRKKGPAVWGPRAQADRAAYPLAVQDLLREYKNITLRADAVGDLMVDSCNGDMSVRGVVTESGDSIYAPSVVIATGTFLGGMIYTGHEARAAGRSGDSPSNKLSSFLKSIFEVSRLRTGTPPRLDGGTIDWDLCEAAYGDNPPVPFSFMHDSINRPNIPCYITRTNANTHKILRDNFHLSALKVHGSDSLRGPRYCPSMEDKVVRFADKDSHRVFLEPEDLDFKVVYPNGISTYVPLEIQQQMVNSIAGLGRAKIIAPGYLIEYDFISPKAINHDMETVKVRNLFFAGQINGTTGYEEAAGQGVVAGANAVLALDKACDRLIPSRANSYIGVMIDDLVGVDIVEPYRLFTSRSEYRLLLRSDNADLRLTELGYKIGLVGQVRYDKFIKKKNDIDMLRSLLKSKKADSSFVQDMGISVSVTGEYKSAYDLFAYAGFSLDRLIEVYPEVGGFASNVLEEVSIEAKYAPYVDRQKKDIAIFESSENLAIPQNIQYMKVPGLSHEAVEKLTKNKPSTIRAALKMIDITPAAVFNIIMYIKNAQHKVSRET